MDEREFFDRWDGHIARIDEHMAMGRKHMARGNELMEEVREEMRLNREERAESREFMREIVGHIERGSREEVRVLRRLADDISDLIAESRAQREGFLRLIDRLGPGPAATDAG